MNPISTPLTRVHVKRSPPGHQCETITTTNGVVAFKIAAIPDETYSSPQLIVKYGITALKIATTKKAQRRVRHPFIIAGLKGTTRSRPSAPKIRRTATNVNGDISAMATLIKRKDAPQRAASAKRTRYSFSFMIFYVLTSEAEKHSVSHLVTKTLVLCVHIPQKRLSRCGRHRKINREAPLPKPPIQSANSVN